MLKHHFAMLLQVSCVGFLIVTRAVIAEETAPIRFDQQRDRVVVWAGQRPLATYVFRDDKITRPYFAHVHTPDGQQVTRHHPPRKEDSQDHATFHPGIWMAFGDISGQDDWRLQAPVVHDRFITSPQGGAGSGSFAVRNRYLSRGGDKTICVETCRYRFLIRPAGYLLIWDSEFSGDEDFYFGDQEEMGLGVRVATPLAVVNGGTILDSQGRKNGREVWGQQADWCDYAGQLGGHHIGVLLMPHPENFRKSWFHARDYGFVAANPFGANAFTRGKKSKIVVPRGQTLRLRFGILLHSDQRGKEPDLAGAYRDYLAQTR